MLIIERNLNPIPEKEYNIERNPAGMTFYKIPEKLWGGCLPHPPIDCHRIALTFMDDGIRWIDLSLCHSCPEIDCCRNRRDFLRALATKRAEALKAIKHKGNTNAE